MSRYVKDANGNWQLSAGMPQIDDELDATSENPVQNKAIVEGMSPIVNVLGAKNLCPTTGTSQTTYGITYTVNSDGSIRATGTATQTSIFIVAQSDSMTESGKDYKLSGCPSGGAETTYRLETYGTGESTWAYDYGDSDGVSFTSDGSVIRVRIIIKPEAGNVNLLFKPMIRPAEVQDSTYVPYAMTNRELTTLTTPKTISTGITGVTALKAGNVVQLRIAMESNTHTAGWNLLGTLPTELYPLSGADFVGLYMGAATAAQSTALEYRLDSIGRLFIWAFSDRLTFGHYANVAYISKY